MSDKKKSQGKDKLFTMKHGIPKKGSHGKEVKELEEEKELVKEVKELEKEVKEEKELKELVKEAETMLYFIIQSTLKRNGLRSGKIKLFYLMKR